MTEAADLRGAIVANEAMIKEATLAKEIAMHIAAASPLVVKREDLPGETLEKEKEIYRAQFAGQNKPANVIEKIVEGKLESYYSQVCMMDQPSVRDPNVTIKQMVASATAKTGENITISRFVRFKLGEATQRLDLRLAWTSTNQKYGLAAYVTNVLDDQYVTGVNNITTDTFGTPFTLISEPRMWGVEATVAF